MVYSFSKIWKFRNYNPINLELKAKMKFFEANCEEFAISNKLNVLILNLEGYELLKLMIDRAGPKEV